MEVKGLGSGFRVRGSGLMVQNLGFRVWCYVSFRVGGSGFPVLMAQSVLCTVPLNGL